MGWTTRALLLCLVFLCILLHFVVWRGLIERNKIFFWNACIVFCCIVVILVVRDSFPGLIFASPLRLAPAQIIVGNHLDLLRLYILENFVTPSRLLQISVQFSLSSLVFGSYADLRCSWRSPNLIKLGLIFSDVWRICLACVCTLPRISTCCWKTRWKVLSMSAIFEQIKRRKGSLLLFNLGLDILAVLVKLLSSFHITLLLRNLDHFLLQINWFLVLQQHAKVFLFFLSWPQI